MPSQYKSRFWKKNWDPWVKDLNSEEFEMSYIELVKPTFEEFSDRMALEYYGVEITFDELDKYSNQFANMLSKNGFKKGDIVGINLPNVPQYPIAALGTLKAGCIVSGVSPLLSSVQIQYQLTDLGSSGKRIALFTLDSIYAEKIVKIAEDTDQLKMVITTNVASFLPKINDDIINTYGEIPQVDISPLKGK
ncbi:MAG: AMP-binding protein, partial [Candidatus Lokiarchaeota archaeon]|nr:AMP-binding protein [Candidatus Lokiarchaeota archaeon]